MSPGEVRAHLERIRSEMLVLERNLDDNVLINVGWIPVTHELAEAGDGVDRALELLDQNYRILS